MFIIHYKKQGQKLSIRTYVKVVMRWITKLIHSLKVTFQVIYNLMKKLCFYDISIFTNFHQNRSINECARMTLQLNWSYITWHDLWGLWKICTLMLAFIDFFTFFYQNRFINEFAWKKKLKFRVFFVSYRITFVLNNELICF